MCRGGSRPLPPAMLASRSISRLLYLRASTQTMAASRGMASAATGGEYPADWAKLANKELRGRRTVEDLETTTADGITVKPMYTKGE